MSRHGVDASTRVVLYSAGNFAHLDSTTPRFWTEAGINGARKDARSRPNRAHTRRPNSSRDRARRWWSEVSRCWRRSATPARL
jgi:hypothetical protein